MRAFTVDFAGLLVWCACCGSTCLAFCLVLAFVLGFTVALLAGRFWLVGWLGLHLRAGLPGACGLARAGDWFDLMLVYYLA